MTTITDINITADTLNARIRDEFDRAGETRLFANDEKPLYVEVGMNREDTVEVLWLNDWNTRIELDAQECLDGGIEQIARDWINATQ